MTSDEATESDSEVDPNSEADESEASPDLVLAVRVISALRILAIRQSEILRVASYLKERTDEIDGVTEKAKRLILQRLEEADEDGIAGAIDFLNMFNELRESGSVGEDEVQEGIKNALNQLVSSLPEGSAQTYLDSVSRAMFAPPGVTMLHASLLVMLVGELEMLVQTVARAVIEHTPGALEESGKTYTWGEVMAFESLDDFRDNVADKMIESVLRGSLDDWMKFFESKFGVQAPAQAKAFTALEAVQRRHLIVHNAGMVSAQYLDKLKQFEVDAEVGDELEVDHEYLIQAADALYVVGFGLAVAAAFKLCRENVSIAYVESAIGDRCFFFLQEGRFDLVREIGTSVKIDRISDEYARLVIQVNTWLALKRLGRFGECRAAVEAFDVSTRNDDFKLAKHALLDELTEAHELAQKMLANGDLRPEFWSTWPLLQEVRQFDRIMRTEKSVENDDGKPVD